MKTIGVIGTGNMGADHARRLSGKVSGARVATVFDVDQARAGEVARSIGATAVARAQDVIDHPEVDAVVIATPGETHAELTMAAIGAGKPVLCEKPLAPTTAECLQVLKAEQSCGKHLVQVGFMRRFDHGYQEVKSVVEGGDIGDVLIVHCLHRNPTVPPSFTSDMSLTDSVVHEIDVARWLSGEEIVSTSVVPVRRSPLAAPGLRDPQLVLLETSSGVVVDVEVFVNARYAYDVRCEVVGSLGVASLETPTVSAVRRDGMSRSVVPDNWRTRFGGAYLAELQAWVDGLEAGSADGPSAWDGYAATAVAESCLRSLESGERTRVELVDKPAFYN